MEYYNYNDFDYLKSLSKTANDERSIVSSPPSKENLPPGEQLEPSDKVMVDIQNYVLNGEYDKAEELLKSYFYNNVGLDQKFSKTYLNLLMSLISDLRKYNNLKNDNYYDYKNKEELDNVKNITKFNDKKDKTIKLIVLGLEKDLKKI